MQNLVKINDVAKFLGITQKTIRYYEEYGLFAPAYVDPHTKYRYYSLDSINTLTFIIDLRQTGMSMQMIKSYMHEEVNPKELLSDLYAKRDSIDNLIKTIEKRISPKKDYEITLMETLPFKAYTKEYLALDFKDIFIKLREFATEAVKEITINKKGVSFVQFLNYNRDLKNIRYKLGIPVYEKETEVISIGKVLHTYYTGNVLDKTLAYNALKVYAMEHNYKIIGEATEFYHKTYSTKELLVEICLPVE